MTEKLTPKQQAKVNINYVAECLENNCYNEKLILKALNVTQRTLYRYIAKLKKSRPMLFMEDFCDDIHVITDKKMKLINDQKLKFNTKDKTKTSDLIQDRQDSPLNGDSKGSNPLGCATISPEPPNSIDPILEDIKKTKDYLQCTAKDAILVRDYTQKMNSKIEYPPWNRPRLAHPKQLECIEAIRDRNIRVVMIDGDKRVGKSNAVWMGICESMWDGFYRRWGFWAKTQRLAEKIHRDVKWDEHTPECTKLYKGQGSVQRTLFFNGGFVEVNSTENEENISGEGYQAIWCDEVHSIIKSNGKTFAMIAMILRSQPQLKLVLSANEGGMEYQDLRDDLFNHFKTEGTEEQFKFIRITKKDAPHITDEADGLVRVLVKASAPELAGQYLDNEKAREDGTYYPYDYIKKSYDNYDSEEFPIPNLELFDAIGCGVDWGDTHDCAFFIVGIHNNKAYELEMIYKKHPDVTYLIQLFARLIRDYPGIIFVWEKSPLGALARNEIEKRFPRQDFINSYFSNEKEAYIDNLYCWLVQEDIYLKNGKLKRELKRYCGDKKMDDGHDAVVHVIYKLEEPRTSLDMKMEWV